MYIIYKNKKLKKLCENNKIAIKKLGPKSAYKLVQRLNEIKAAPNLETMVKFRIGRCHPLEGNLKGKYALDLEHPFRLIIEPVYKEDSSYNHNLKLSNINIVKIVEVIDYHGN